MEIRRPAYVTRRLFFIALLAVTPLLCAANPPGTPFPAELQQVKSATGGLKWDRVTVLTADGTKNSFGLTGKFHSVEDPVHGFFERRANYEIYANAEGFDREGRWRQDNSGQIHPLDSDEATAVAVSESYLARRGYLFPDRMPATYRLLDPATENKTRFVRILVEPQNGRAITLRIDTSTHYLTRAEMELSEGVKTIDYADYRTVDGLLLPFQITNRYRDDLDTGTATLAVYQVSTVAAGQELKRPQPQFSDVHMPPGTKKTTPKAYLDPTSGFFIVEAKINGKGPLLFIFDTGGHNILTQQSAHDLGLVAVGKGFATGNGAGSTPTEFTKVKTLTIGEADVSDQPFTILHLDLGTTKDGNQKAQVVAGILGLELLERFAVTLDTTAPTLTLQPLSDFTYQGTGVAVPLHFTSDEPLVMAALDGHSGWFDIDTANNDRLIVYRQWAVSNQLAETYAKGTKMSGESVGGDVEFTMASAKSFQIGGQELGSIDISLASENAGSLSARSEAGNAGMSVLSHFTVTFDYRSENMYLQPR